MPKTNAPKTKTFSVTVWFANNGSYNALREAESEDHAVQNELKNYVPPRDPKARKDRAITGCRAVEEPRLDCIRLIFAAHRLIRRDRRDDKVFFRDDTNEAINAAIEHSAFDPAIKGLDKALTDAYQEKYS